MIRFLRNLFRLIRLAMILARHNALFPLEALRPDVHVNAIGAFRPTMRELPDELLADAALVHVDLVEAAATG